MKVQYRFLWSLILVRKRIIHILFILLLLAGGSSAYAGCTVNGVTESGAISLANLKVAIATGTDDVTTCNVNWKFGYGIDFITKGGWNSSASFMIEESVGSIETSKHSDSFRFNVGVGF